jgi:hypothetical protein
MSESWRIPAGVEETFREALDHAGKGRVSELHAMPGHLSTEQIDGSVGLCGLVAAYTAIDVVERRWPTDAGVRRMAKKTAESGRDAQRGVTQENVYRFLSKCALGFKPFAEVFGDSFEDPREFFAAPFFMTVDLLATFTPDGQTIWEFLDVIEDAYEKAWLLDLNLLPALMVRARMQQKPQAPNATADGQQRTHEGGRDH